MPMLTEIAVSPPVKRIGSREAREIRSAISTTSRSEARSSNSSVNSSPPKRASVSIGRSIPRRRRASAASTSSPAAWPWVSLMSLKLSTSMNRTASDAPVRAARSSATPNRSRNSARFGRRVSGSCSASSDSAISERLRSSAKVTARSRANGASWAVTRQSCAPARTARIASSRSSAGSSAMIAACGAAACSASITSGPSASASAASTQVAPWSVSSVRALGRLEAWTSTGSPAVPARISWSSSADSR